MEIKIENYLSQGEIKDICREFVSETIRNGGERVVSNLAYECAWKILDESLTPEHLDLIKETALKVISDLTAYSVFRKKDAWGSDDSIAYKELQKAIDEHKHIINDKVKSVIEKHDYESEMTSNSDMFSEYLIQALSKGLSK